MKSCCSLCEPKMSCRFSRGKTMDWYIIFNKQLHPTDAIYMLIQRGHFALWVQFVQFEGGLPPMSMSMSINCCRDFPHHSKTILCTQASCSFVSTIYSEDILSSSRYPIGWSDEEPSEDMWQNVKLVVTFIPSGLYHWQWNRNVGMGCASGYAKFLHKAQDHCALG